MRVIGMWWITEEHIMSERFPSERIISALTNNLYSLIGKATGKCWQFASSKLATDF